MTSLLRGLAESLLLAIWLMATVSSGLAAGRAMVEWKPMSLLVGLGGVALCTWVLWPLVRAPRNRTPRT